jgi:hypothetical protein
MNLFIGDMEPNITNNECEIFLSCITCDSALSPREKKQITRTQV